MKYTKNNYLTITDKPYYNRTFKFLGPQINRIMSEGQLILFNQLEWLTFSIYDENYDDTEFNLHCIFKPYNIDYTSLLNNKYYIRDYPINKDTQCIVYSLPIDNIESFILGDYTKMYTEEQIEEMFISTIESEDGIEYFSEVYSVLTGMVEYQQSFVDKINEDFNSDITINSLVKKELDYPPLLSQEVLNYTITGKSNDIKQQMIERDKIFDYV